MSAEGLRVDFSLEDEKSEDRARRDRICAHASVLAVAYEDEAPPPYVQHIYMHDDAEHGHEYVWAGTVSHEDRWPTTDEMQRAMSDWRGPSSPVFVVRCHGWGVQLPPDIAKRLKRFLFRSLTQSNFPSGDHDCAEAHYLNDRLKAAGVEWRLDDAALPDGGSRE